MDNLQGYKEALKFILEAKYIGLRNYIPNADVDKPILIRSGFSKRGYYICACGKNSRIRVTRQTGIVEGLHWICPKCGNDNVINHY